MKTKRILSVLSIVFAFFMAFGCYFALNGKTVNAEEPAVKYALSEVELNMVDGAWLRTNDADGKMGIRFVAGMSEEHYQGLMNNVGDDGLYKNVQFGVVITYEAYNDVHPVNSASLFGYEGTKLYDWAIYNSATGEWEYDETSPYQRVVNIYADELKTTQDVLGISGSLTEIKDANLDLNFVGIGYVKAEKQDGTPDYLFATETEGENVIRLAQKTYDTISNQDVKDKIQSMYLDRATALTADYTVEHYVSNPNGDGYYLAETEQKTAKVGSVITADTVENLTILPNLTRETDDINVKVYAGQAIETIKVYYTAKMTEKTVKANAISTGSDNEVDRTLSGLNQSVYYLANQAGELIYVKEDAEEVVLSKDSLAVGETWLYALTDEGWVKVEIVNATHLIADASELNAYVNSATEDTYAVLTNKITMPTSSWSVSGTFNGVLDGQENTIDGLKTGDNLGLFKTIAGTIKNVVFTNVIVSAGGATIAKNMSGIVNIKNVYINVKSFDGAKGYHQSAVIANARGSYMLNYDGVVAIAPALDDASAGLAIGYGHQVTVSIKNSAFAGVNGKLYGFREESGYILKPALSNSVEGTDYFVGDDVTDIYLARKSGKLVMADFISAEFDKIHNVTEVSSLEEIQQLSGTENVVLTSDISRSSAFDSGSSSFSGIFNGNGHSISIMPARNATGRALFTTFNGTMKNVAFTNINLGIQTALVGYNTKGATVKDVYVEVVGIVVGSNLRAYQSGGLFGKFNEGTVKLQDVIVEFTNEMWDGKQSVPATKLEDETSEYGFVSGWIKPSATLLMENCHFIGGNGRIYGYKLDGSNEYKPKNELSGYEIYNYTSSLKSVVGTTVVFDGMIKTFYDKYIGN